jgi:hypothetical protein
MQYDYQNRSMMRLATLPGVAMVPLGWWHTNPLFLVATGSDTSLYLASAGMSHFLGVLAPQVVTSAALSPRAPLVAFVAPTNCYNGTRVRLGRSVDLPKTWSHSLSVMIGPLGVHVLDTITGRSVFSAFRVGTL